MRNRLLLLSIFMLVGSVVQAAAPSANETLDIGGGKLHIDFANEASASRKVQLNWITRAATAVAKYFGKYPVKDVWISVNGDGEGHHVGGTTWAGRKIELRLGKAVEENDLAHDWTATHEMFHLAFPDIEGDYQWMTEGFATYLEPVARVRVGDIKVDQFWGDMIDGLPKGEPVKGGQGLNGTPSWGRTYWGGALFWFTADLEIREKTKNKKSLDDAMKGILKSGGDGSATWTQEKVFQVCDKAIGMDVFAILNKKMVLAPGDVDLAGVWKKLGIARAGDRLIYDDKAPLAFVRKAMTASVP